MTTAAPRDLVGYAGNPPHPKWPGEARIAVNFVMNYEEGSEYNAADDGFSEGTLTESGAANYGVKGRDLAAEGMFEYGSRVGFWRVHAHLQGARAAPHRVRLRAGARAQPGGGRGHPASRAATSARTAGAGSSTTSSSEDEEREHIRLAVESMKKTTGERPLGWYCRYGPSVNTRRLVVEEGGFLYDSDAYNDELPYWVRVDEKPHLVVPYSLDRQRLEVRQRRLRHRGATTSRS